MKKNILVLAGGGIKGYAQAQVLKRMEEKYGPLHKYYDLIAGSSVGAINGSMIASGKITMDKMESIYPDMVKKIFKKSWFPLAVPMYDRKNFVEIFNNEIGMIKMKECQTKFMATSVNLCDKINHFFKSWETKDGEEYVASTVCKSFAATLYFGTLVEEKTQSVWMDGGMGSDNLPLIRSYIEAQLLFPNDDWHFDIVGCGFCEETIPFNTAKGFRLFRQLGEFFNLKDGGLAREQSRYEQISALEKIAKSAPDISMCYYDRSIEKKIDKLDCVECLEAYKSIGIDMANNPLIIT